MTTTWRGNRGSGTSGYGAYSRDHEIEAEGKSGPLPCSSDAAFRGDGTRYNPEELLVGSLSACHMLWYLHLCSIAGIVVTEYRDRAAGRMRMNEDGSGEFVEVVLRPEVRLADERRAAEAAGLHAKAHAMCFIARSVRFPVRVSL
ncbi:MAG: OsmC family protein [Bryobacteraceae bacterium]